MEILEQNFRCRKGEIDIIAKDMDYLVFIEVKYRKNMEKGSPFAAVGYKKQKTICEVADFYHYMKHIDANQKIRYDVVAVLGEEIKHLKNAFYHISARNSW